MDSFEVTVTDDQGGTTTQVVNVTLTNVDDAAVIGGNITGTENEGVTVAGTLTATDADGLTDGTYFTITGTLPTNGTAAIDATYWGLDLHSDGSELVRLGQLRGHGH